MTEISVNNVTLIVNCVIHFIGNRRHLMSQKNQRQYFMRQFQITKQITNHDALSIDRYFVEISKIKLLSAEQEVILARRIKKGDRQALDTLVKANLRFVVSVLEKGDG